MSEQSPEQSLAEWLAESPNRYVVLRRAETPDEGGGDQKMARPGYVRFDLYSRLADGRKVAFGDAWHWLARCGTLTVVDLA